MRRSLVPAAPRSLVGIDRDDARLMVNLLLRKKGGGAERRAPVKVRKG
jgi:hypothetical protein